MLRTSVACVLLCGSLVSVAVVELSAFVLFDSAALFFCSSRIRVLYFPSYRVRRLFQALCSDVYDMQISEAVGGVPEAGTEPCRFPKLEECAHFHYERVNLPQLTVTLQTSMDQSLHSQHGKSTFKSKKTTHLPNCICFSCSQRRRRRISHGTSNFGRRVLASAAKFRKLQDARRPAPPMHL